MIRPVEPLVEINDERFIIDLLYNTDNHILNRPIYRDFGIERCYAHPDLRERLDKLPPLLKERGLKLVIYDCYRPLAVQKEFWRILPDPRYVADPAEGSHHNRAVAIDCYLAREDGTPLDFPTVPDGYIPGIEKDFVNWMAYLEKAHHSYPGGPGEEQACANRDMLRSLMAQIGLNHIEEEWWHYELADAFSYPLIENLSGAI